MFVTLEGSEICVIETDVNAIDARHTICKNTSMMKIFIKYLQRTQ